MLQATHAHTTSAERNVTARARRAATRRRKDDKLTALRVFGRPMGVAWLRDILKEHKVERISGLPESTIDHLLADFEAAELEAAE